MKMRSAWHVSRGEMKIHAEFYLMNVLGDHLWGSLALSEANINMGVR
jgi:hypothetical protein